MFTKNLILKAFKATSIYLIDSNIILNRFYYTTPSNLRSFSRSLVYSAEN